MRAKTFATLMAMACCTPAWAETIHCVASGDELAEALSLATQVWDVHEIRVVVGRYDFISDVTMAPANAASKSRLILSGGWDASCTAQALGAQRTVLQAGIPGLRVDLAPTDGLHVSDLTFVGFEGGVTLGETHVWTPGWEQTWVSAARIAVFSEHTQPFALRLDSHGYSIVENILVDATAECALAMRSNAGNGSAAAWASTLIARPLGDGTSGSAACFESVEPTVANVAVNSVFSSAGPDVRVDGPSVTMQANVFGDVASCSHCDGLGPDSSDNFIRESAFDGPVSDVASWFARVRSGSAAMSDLLDTALLEHVGEPFDVEGDARPTQEASSRGAFQLLDPLLSDGFEAD